MSLYHWHNILGNNKNNNFFSPYLGPIYNKSENLNAIKKIILFKDFNLKKIKI